MVKHILSLYNGNIEISSGTAGEPAIRDLVLTETVNSEELLMPGTVSAAMLEITMFADPEVRLLAAGRKFELYTEDEQGLRTKNGVFYVEKVEWTGVHTCVITAYDNVISLDREVTTYLQSLTGWPYSLQNLAAMVCRYCGLTLTTLPFPNGTFKVNMPTGYSRIYGRQVMQWICQLAGRFCRATVDGKLEMGWYAPAQVRVGPGAKSGAPRVDWENGVLFLEAENVTADAEGLTVPEASWSAGVLSLQIPDVMETVPYFQGGFRRGDSPLFNIGAVWLAYSYASIGAVCPDSGSNVMALVGNPLLENATESELELMAQVLYTQFHPISYTTCRLKVPASANIRPGEILEFSDGARTFTAYVMRTVRTGGMTELVSTGGYRWDSATAINNRYKNSV